jgi:hypothetical protein
MSRMLQFVPLIFQKFQAAPGNSTRHECDMARNAGYCEIFSSPKLAKSPPTASSSACRQDTQTFAFRNRIFVLSVRECHGRVASVQTQGTNELALRIGLRSF